MSETKESLCTVTLNNVQEKLKQAITLHQNGDLTTAKLLYENILRVQPEHPDALHLLGVIALQYRDYMQAVTLIDKAISIIPNNAAFYSNRGLALQELKQIEAAIASYNQAIAIDPNYADAYCNRGSALNNLNQFEQAIASYDQAIAVKPDYADAYYNRGCVLHDLGHLEAALTSYNQAITIQPKHASAYCNIGNVLKILEQPERALASYDQAISIQPDHVEAHYNRANTLSELGQLEAAIAGYDRAIAIRPDYAEAYSNRGYTLYEFNQFEAAMASCQQAITIQPHLAKAYCNLGCVQSRLNQTEEAIASYDKAIALQPDYVDSYCNRGNALQELGELDAALACYDQAIAIDPNHANAFLGKSVLLLLLGDFENGWKLYEWRWKVKKIGLVPRQFPQPLWLGEQSLDGKTILVHTEQGLGDVLQFCRYTKLVSALGARVILEVPESLIGLLSGLEGVTQLVEVGRNLPDFDYHCPLLSLPLALKTTLKNIPSAPSYLQVNAQKRALWSLRLGTKVKLRVGLVWSGSSTHKRDHNRSLNLTSLLSYLPDGFEYVCLQKKLRDIDKSVMAANPHILFFGNKLRDFTDTAALCELMDLVISVDTSIVHLAGALGKETWVLLPSLPDWRWLLDREDSPWYPSVRLYRQSVRYDWQSVLQKLHIDLLARLDLTRSTHPTNH